MAAITATIAADKPSLIAELVVAAAAAAPLTALAIAGAPLLMVLLAASSGRTGRTGRTRVLLLKPILLLLLLRPAPTSTPSEATPLLLPVATSSGGGGGGGDDCDKDDDVCDDDVAASLWELDPAGGAHSTSSSSTAVPSRGNPTTSTNVGRAAVAVPVVASSILLFLLLLQFLLAFRRRDPSSSSLSAWFAVPALFAMSLIAAPIIAAASAAAVEGTYSSSTIAFELDKRTAKHCFLALASFYAVYAASSSTVVVLVVVGFLQTLPDQGVFAGVSVAAAVAQALVSLAASAALVRTSIRVPVAAIRRKLINGKKPSPELDASLFSRWTFSWFNYVMDHGYKNEMSLADLWSVNPAENIDSNLQRYHRLRNRHPTASLLYVLYLFNRKTMIKQSFYLTGSTALFFSGPFFLNRILDFLDHRNEQNSAPVWVAYAFVFGMLLTALIRFALDGQVNLLVKKIGIRNANILSGLIYRKALRRSPQIALEGDERGASVGKIVSLMSVDSQSVGQWVGMLYSPVVTFVQIVIAVTALVYVLGVAALAGVSLLVLLIFSGAPLAGMMRKRFSSVKVFRDRRVNAFNEFLQGIKIIKLFAWEKQFEEKIDVLRERELRNVFETKVVAAMNRVLWFSAPLLTTFVTLLTYTVVMGKQLDATVAFTALSLFNLLRGPLQMFPDTLVQLIDTWVSFQRIDLFLQEEELEEFTNPASNKATDSSRSTVLGFENASFEWSENAARPPEPTRPNLFSLGWLTRKQPLAPPPLMPDSIPEQRHANVFTLTDVDGQFPASKLSVIIGATGAGKSSLLLALLGEMRRTHGRRSCPVDSTTTLLADAAAAAEAPSFVESLGVAYVPQVPWLLNATVRDNILFGKPFDPVRYRRVIEACALVKDFETLDGGDMTEVGEKGINLSGGQKQRMSLARAAYSDSPWVLLDDPLSAVDAPTARHIYEHCVLDLLANRTRLLVTNAVGLAVPRADYLVLIQSGCIASQGAVEDVLSDLAAGRLPRSPFGDSVAEAVPVILAERARFAADAAAAAANGSLDGKAVVAAAGGKSDDPAATTVGTTAAGGESTGASDTDTNRKKKARLVDDETMASGNVSLAVYYLYYTALGGLPFLSILIAGYAVNIGLTVYMDVIVAHWTKSYEKSASYLWHALSAGAFSIQQEPASQTWTGSTVDERSKPVVDGSFAPYYFATEEDPTTYYLKYYAEFTVLTIVAIIIRLVILAYVQQRAGRTIHQEMMRNVLGAPLRFFEVTPLGRIINRFSKDLGALDFEVGASAGNTIYQTLVLLFVVGTITSVVPPLLFLLLPLGYVYALIGLYYIRTSRSLKRIDSVARSPIYSHFGETLAGVSVIRAFHRTTAFSAESCRRFDDSNRASYYLHISAIWASIRMQLLSALVMFAAGLLILISGVDASVAGLCLNFTLQLSEALIALVRNQSWLEMSMNSVERCDDYLKLEQEAPANLAGNRPPKDWPQEGKISVQNLEMRYSKETPLVLHGISADIFPREKVGIVGRTGAGKSTLTLALFRIIEPAGGTVVIDGVDIRTLGLHDLRSSLTIIPQDPVLFAGTVRSNLDPFDSLDDATLWNALRRAHLVGDPHHPDDAPRAPAAAPAASSSTPPSAGYDTVSVESDGVDGDETIAEKKQSLRHAFRITLDTPIAEGGANLSAGQRQLLCLARALARTSKVIVLDEATASVDTETDSRIQDTIRTELSNSTVLTIAHRLKTIVDYDRVIVLDQGRIIENDTPHRLISQSKVGVFRKMCEESGEFEELVLIAQEAEAKRR
ncbi:hypothetical protein DFJ73DRAFT_961231 [Zopfochytrium polystomum]|nr:hypothetical protein DFJ73DRAFT_961231 [Zopfochytrium polystomum]